MEEKGQKLLDEGDKQLGKFSLFSSKDEKYDKAYDKFQQAATQFKACQCWNKAAEAYEKCAQVSEKLKNEVDYTTALENAAMALRKADDPRAKTLLTNVISQYERQGKLRMAAKFCVQASEDPSVKPEEGMELLQRAIKYYKSDNSRASATELVQKTADMMIRSGKYAEAKETYLQLAKEALDDRLTRMSARKHFFMSLLAQLASIDRNNADEGTSELRESFEQAQDLDTQFTSDTREHMLISGILTALEEGDLEVYEHHVDDYDNIVPLDQLKNKMLLRGKMLLRREGDDLR